MKLTFMISLLKMEKSQIVSASKKSFAKGFRKQLVLETKWEFKKKKYKFPKKKKPRKFGQNKWIWFTLTDLKVDTLDLLKNTYAL